LLADNTASEENLPPLLETLVLNLDTTTATLKTLEGNVDTGSGGSQDDVAQRAASIVEVSA
jgi:hypothetical protein